MYVIMLYMLFDVWELVCTCAFTCCWKLLFCTYACWEHIGDLVTWWPSLHSWDPRHVNDGHTVPTVRGMWVLDRDPHHEDDGQRSLYSWSIGNWSLCQRAQARVYIDGCIPRITGKMRKEIKINRSIACSHYISMEYLWCNGSFGLLML